MAWTLDVSAPALPVLKKLKLSPVAPLLILLSCGVSWYRSLVAFDRRWPARLGCCRVFFVFWLSQPFTNSF